MTDEAKKLLDELKPEHRQEFKMLMQRDARHNGLVKTINMLAARHDYKEMNDTIRLLDRYEDGLLADFCARFTKEVVTLDELTKRTDTQMTDEQREQFKLLANVSLCYANLLDNAYQDLTELLSRFGYNPKTTELFKATGEKMKNLVRETFGDMPIEWVDSFDDACAKADELTKNKMRSFMRKRERAWAAKGRKSKATKQTKP